MSDFEILEHGEIARELYGIENKEINELELEALLEGKRLWTDIIGEYAITIRLKNNVKKLNIDKENEMNKEIERLKNINEEHRILNGKLRVENSRLNNIINELEKWLRNEYSKYNGAIRIASVLDKIQELKGEDKE